MSGTVGGTAFNTVASAYVIGAPDSSATTVVYVFSNAVACGDLAAPGWDRRITNATAVLEMKLFGLSRPRTRWSRVSCLRRGRPTVNYTLSSTAGTPVETTSQSGTVTLGAIAPMGPGTGAFDLLFGADHLTGHFSATYCPGGHEP